MSKISLAVLFGGVSSEHEVSRISAGSVIKNVNREKYDLHVIGITKDGRWYYYTGSVEDMADGSWEKKEENLTPAIVSPDRSVHGITLFEKDGIKNIRLDAAFPVMHGRNGEDGTIQGLFELADIPYVGCDVASSAICMDKALTNIMLAKNGIDQADFVWFYSREFFADSEKIIALIENKLGYPCFVKPANAGSSVGISKAKDRAGLIEAIKLAADNDFKIVVEESITGAEVEVAVMGNENPIASVPGEIAPANDWYDYEAKYNNVGSELFIPARLSPELSEKVRERAVEGYKVLGCTGLARVDFFVTAKGRILLNEPNTLPGFTSISMFPKLFGATGVPYDELIDRLITYAIERKQ
ncbi:MAG: D-alanine--D-alanine ligase [Clostridia bacterium]|nr:D-alanine--D-alanine ligase [Clostridia bacterium]